MSDARSQKVAKKHLQQCNDLDGRRSDSLSRTSSISGSLLSATSSRSFRSSRSCRSFRSGSALRRRDCEGAIKVLAHARARSAATPLRRNTLGASSNTRSKTVQRMTQPKQLSPALVVEECSQSSVSTSNTSSSTSSSSSGSSGIFVTAPRGGRVGGEGRTRGSPYTREEMKIVKRILRAKASGYGAHYRVLELDPDCSQMDIKRAFRRVSLKVDPEKNSAPRAADAFAAVRLAHSVLSNSQKRAAYDLYDDEDSKTAETSTGHLCQFCVYVTLRDLEDFEQQCCV